LGRFLPESPAVSKSSLLYSLDVDFWCLKDLGGIHRVAGGYAPHLSRQSSGF
jgi:hypothetical protein